MLSAGLTGFWTALGLILAIGAQNAFVLRVGLQKHHVFWVCLFCASSDALLIGCGIYGIERFVAGVPWFMEIMAILGISFLVFYAATRFLASWRNQYLFELSGAAQPLGKTLSITASFTWLNPHVYLDTLALIGANSIQFSGNDLLAYGLSAAFASFFFFFSLGYGARLLAPIMTRARFWRILDFAFGIIMLAIALALYQKLLA